MGEWRGVWRVLVGNLMEREHFKDTGIDGRILRRMCRKWDGGDGLN
jgi:hypothetical protein